MAIAEEKMTGWLARAQGMDRAGEVDLEREIVAKGLTAPRITPADIEDNIVGAYYFTAEDGVIGADMPANGTANRRDLASRDRSESLGLLTFCVLVLRNGFTVTGESACASPENFDAEIGRKIARQNAVQKIWPLMGYQLKDRLYQSVQPAQAPE